MTKIITRSYAYGDIILMSGIFENLLMSDTDFVFRTDPDLVEWFDYAPYETIPYTRAYDGEHITLDDVIEQEEDRLIQLGNNRNRIAIACNILGIEPKILCPAFYTTDREWEVVKGIKNIYPHPYIGIAPSSRYACKTLDIQQWIEIINHLILVCGGTIFIFDSPTNFSKIKVNGNLHFLSGDWRKLTRWCMAMDLMLTHDSVWCHISAGVGTPQILLTSCTDGQLIGKQYPNIILPRPPHKCYPCFYRFREGCNKNSHPKCLSINTQVFVSNILNLLKGEQSEWNLWTL